MARTRFSLALSQCSFSTANIRIWLPNSKYLLKSSLHNDSNPIIYSHYLHSPQHILPINLYLKNPHAYWAQASSSAAQCSSGAMEEELVVLTNCQLVSGNDDYHPTLPGFAKYTSQPKPAGSRSSLESKKKNRSISTGQPFRSSSQLEVTCNAPYNVTNCKITNTSCFWTCYQKKNNLQTHIVHSGIKGNTKSAQHNALIWMLPTSTAPLKKDLSWVDVYGK